MDGMLSGTYQHNIDPKGRVAIPAKLRGALGDNFVVSKPIDKQPCLCVFPMQVWEDLTSKIANLKLAQARAVRRYLYSGAISTALDSQGRVLLPQSLRDVISAQSGDSVTLVGADDCIEIWKTSDWEALDIDSQQDDVFEILGEI
ncbi:MAG: division/cell wall cluster transcriptional repressor MraZ [Clostridia bacterium]|nr:division/cell wall cluster transcriptional repressor MraZ [Clostridia bacterium]